MNSIVKLQILSLLMIFLAVASTNLEVEGLENEYEEHSDFADDEDEPSVSFAEDYSSNRFSPDLVGSGTGGPCVQDISTDKCNVSASAVPVQVTKLQGFFLHFSVSQNFKSSAVSWISAAYPSPSGNLEQLCIKSESVNPGVFAEYSSYCRNGYVDVTLYLHDGQFSQTDGSDITKDIPLRCSPSKDKGKKCAKTYRISCNSKCVNSAAPKPPALTVADYKADKCFNDGFWPTGVKHGVFRAASPKFCQMKCEQDPNCNSWALNRYSRYCYLFSASTFNPKGSSPAQYVAGPKTCPDGTYHKMTVCQITKSGYKTVEISSQRWGPGITNLHTIKVGVLDDNGNVYLARTKDSEFSKDFGDTLGACARVCSARNWRGAKVVEKAKEAMHAADFVVGKDEDCDNVPVCAYTDYAAKYRYRDPSRVMYDGLMPKKMVTYIMYTTDKGMGQDKMDAAQTATYVAAKKAFLATYNPKAQFEKHQEKLGNARIPSATWIYPLQNFLLHKCPAPVSICRIPKGKPSALEDVQVAATLADVVVNLGDLRGKCSDVKPDTPILVCIDGKQSTKPYADVIKRHFMQSGACDRKFDFDPNSDNPVADHFLDCPPGQYNVWTGETDLFRRGYFQCQVCPEGTFSFGGKASWKSCTRCDPGYYAGQGASACLPCSPGTYASSGGSKVCQFCPTHTFCSSFGCTKCQPCDAAVNNGLATCPQNRAEVDQMLEAARKKKEAEAARERAEAEAKLRAAAAAEKAKQEAEAAAARAAAAAANAAANQSEKDAAAIVNIAKQTTTDARAAAANANVATTVNRGPSPQQVTQAKQETQQAAAAVKQAAANVQVAEKKVEEEEAHIKAARQALADAKTVYEKEAAQKEAELATVAFNRRLSMYQANALVMREKLVLYSKVHEAQLALRRAINKKYKDATDARALARAMLVHSVCRLMGDPHINTFANVQKDVLQVGENVVYQSKDKKLGVLTTSENDGRTNVNTIQKVTINSDGQYHSVAVNRQTCAFDNVGFKNPYGHVFTYNSPDNKTVVQVMGMCDGNGHAQMTVVINVLRRDAEESTGLCAGKVFNNPNTPQIVYGKR